MNYNVFDRAQKLPKILQSILNGNKTQIFPLPIAGCRIDIPLTGPLSSEYSNHTASLPSG